MAEEFEGIENTLADKRSLEERLKQYPELKTKIEVMLGIMENAGGDVQKADEAERRIIEELRQMGNEILHGWARRQHQRKEDEFMAMPGVNLKQKKPLLAHAARENRNSRADLHAGPARSRDPAVCRIRGGRVPRALQGFAAGDDRFWGG